MINGRRKKKKQKTKWFAKQVHIHFLDFSLIIAFFVQHIVMQQCEKLRGVSGFGATNTLYIVHFHPPGLMPILNLHKKRPEWKIVNEKKKVKISLQLFC